MWSSIANDGYIGVTGHFVDKDWNMQALTLTTEEMDDRHTGINISARLKDVAATWGVKEKVSAVVHDNAANMMLALRLL